MLTFDGPNKLVILDDTTTLWRVETLYSRWKDWVASGIGAKFLPAFRAIGGDPLGSGQFSPTFVFLQNNLGWRIRKPSATIEVVIQGNLSGEDPSLPLMTDPALAGFTPLITINRTAVAKVDLGNIEAALLLATDYAKIAMLQTQPAP